MDPNKARRSSSRWDMQPPSGQNRYPSGAYPGISAPGYPSGPHTSMVHPEGPYGREGTSSSSYSPANRLGPPATAFHGPSSQGQYQHAQTREPYLAYSGSASSRDGVSSYRPPVTGSSHPRDARTSAHPPAMDRSDRDRQYGEPARFSTRDVPELVDKILALFGQGMYLQGVHLLELFPARYGQPLSILYAQCVKGQSMGAGQPDAMSVFEWLAKLHPDRLGLERIATTTTTTTTTSIDAAQYWFKRRDRASVLLIQDLQMEESNIVRNLRDAFLLRACLLDQLQALYDHPIQIPLGVLMRLYAACFGKTFPMRDVAPAGVKDAQGWTAWLNKEAVQGLKAFVAGPPESKDWMDRVMVLLKMSDSAVANIMATTSTTSTKSVTSTTTAPSLSNSLTVTRVPDVASSPSATSSPATLSLAPSPATLTPVSLPALKPDYDAFPARLSTILCRLLGCFQGGHYVRLSDLPVLYGRLYGTPLSFKDWTREGGAGAEFKKFGDWVEHLPALDARLKWPEEGVTRWVKRRDRAAFAWRAAFADQVRSVLSAWMASQSTWLSTLLTQPFNLEDLPNLSDVQSHNVSMMPHIKREMPTIKTEPSSHGMKRDATSASLLDSPDAPKRVKLGALASLVTHEPFLALLVRQLRSLYGAGAGSLTTSTRVRLTSLMAMLKTCYGGFARAGLDLPSPLQGLWTALKKKQGASLALRPKTDPGPSAPLPASSEAGTSASNETEWAEQDRTCTMLLEALLDDTSSVWTALVAYVARNRSGPPPIQTSLQGSEPFVKVEPLPSQEAIQCDCVSCGADKNQTVASSSPQTSNAMSGSTSSNVVGEMQVRSPQPAQPVLTSPPVPIVSASTHSSPIPTVRVPIPPASLAPSTPSASASTGYPHPLARPTPPLCLSARTVLRPPAALAMETATAGLPDRCGSALPEWRLWWDARSALPGVQSYAVFHAGPEAFFKLSQPPTPI